MKLRWPYSLGWLLWAAAGVILEVSALLDTQLGDTLSENLWFLLGSHPIVWFVGLGLAVWAGRHIFLRKR